MKADQTILLSHGSGGKISHDLITGIFVRYFNNPELEAQTDSAVLSFQGETMAFTTDSYVVDPIFFQGGNIGKLAVCGTVNDLSVSDAIPQYLSCSFIIEEGFPLADLERVVESMADEAVKAGVKIVTGDTKVVNRGKCDKIFINTAGIGIIEARNKLISAGHGIIPGDKIIINGSIGDHGIAILAARESLSFQSGITSDCASLNHLIREVLGASENIRFMRDPTRGGLATVLCELASRVKMGVRIDETKVSIHDNVRGACEIFGFDPFYLANEGKVVFIVGNDDANKVLETLKCHPLGQDATVIGTIVKDHPGKVVLETAIGGHRILDMLTGEMLPRIC